MSRRGSTPDVEPAPESLRSPGKRPRRDVFEIVRVLYSGSAIGLWGVITVLALRFGGPALATAAELAQAITRMSVAIERGAADGAATRLDVSAIRGELGASREQGQRIESKVDRLTEICARPCDRR